MPKIEGLIDFSDSEDELEYDKTCFDSVEDAREYEAVEKAERVSYKSNDDESVEEKVPAKSRNQKKKKGKSKIQVEGLLDFSDSESENELAKDEPYGSVEDALARQDEVMAELFDNVSEDDEPVKIPSRWKTAVKGLLVWDDDSDIEVDEEEGEPKEHAFTRNRLGLGEVDDNTNSHENTEGAVGKQEVDSLGLTDSGSD